ncbi:MAG: outer membrane beta-barrel protein [Pseudomonadota bacterium]|nr:MAG: outer membrane beta-barrel protein [Pseudomonadota bacterium]
MTLRTRLIIALLLMLPFAAQAADASSERKRKNKAYAGGTIAMWDRYDLLSVAGVGGYDITRWFAMEGHLGTSRSEDVNVGGVQAKAQVDVFFSVFTRFNLVYQRATWFALLGGSYLNFGGDGRAVWQDATTTSDSSNYVFSPSYGLGVELFAGKKKRASMTFSWVRYLDTDKEGEADTFNIGFSYHFGGIPYTPRY